MPSAGVVKWRLTDKMRSLFQALSVALLLGLFSLSLSAQEKTQSYYNTHESEILPDARAAFQRGDYERSVELCKWHYIIVGDKAANPLREMAERCASLSQEMISSQAAGRINEARELAKTLLSLNANDPGANRLMEELLQPATPISPDTVRVVNSSVADTVVIRNPVLNEHPVEEEVLEPVAPTLPEPVKDPHPDSRLEPEPRPAATPGTRFVILAGASFLDIRQPVQTISPGAAIGLYDLGGSRLGAEVGAYVCPDLLSSGTLFGIDASLVYRIARNVYSMLGAGLISFNGAGFCAGAGLSFLPGSHLCVEIGAKLYPELRTHGVELVSTTPGVSYSFPSVIQVIPGGLVPSISVGWAF